MRAFSGRGNSRSTLPGRARILKACRGPLIVLLGFGGLIAAHGSTDVATTGTAPAWQRYQSEHFELYSAISDVGSRQLLRRLELLQAVFADMVRTHEQRPNPITIYGFASDEAFRSHAPTALRAEARLGAFYLHRPDRSVIVLSPLGNDESAQRLTFHEYIHHLSRVNGETPPLWYAEGIAEYFSTITEADGQLSLGLPIDEHLAYLRGRQLMTLPELFAVDSTSGDYHESERVGLFYAQSWLLMHYFYCGMGELTAGKLAARERFLRLVRNEGEHGDALARESSFKEFTGLDYAAAQRELERYLRTGKYTWQKLALPTLPPISDYAVAAVSSDEIARRLAELDLRVNRTMAARRTMVDAAAQSPVDIRALEILGTAALADGDVVGARNWWEQAVAAGTTNAAVMHELLSLQSQGLFNQLNLAFVLPDAKAAALRTLLFKSIERAPNQTQAFEILAWVEATVKQPSTDNINLVQEHLPSLRPRDRTLLALALIRARFGDFATARLLLDQAEKEATAPQAAQWSQTLRSLVNRREALATGKR